MSALRLGLGCALILAGWMASGCDCSHPVPWPGVWFVESEPNDTPEAATVIPPDLAVGTQNYECLDTSWGGCAPPWTVSHVNGAADVTDVIHVIVDKSLLTAVVLPEEKKLAIDVDPLHEYSNGLHVGCTADDVGPYYGAGDGMIFCLYVGGPPPFDGDGTDLDPPCDGAFATASRTLLDDVTWDCDWTPNWDCTPGHCRVVFEGSDIATDYYLVFKALSTEDKDLCYALDVFDGNKYCGSSYGLCGD